MRSYIILLLLLLLVFLLIPEKKFNKKGLLLLFLVLALCYGLRNNIGKDDQAYIWQYNIFSNSLDRINTAFTNTEFGLKILCRIIGLFKFNYKGLFLCCSLISFTFLYKFIYNLHFTKKEMFLFILMYLGMLFTPFLIVMRHFLAISICVYALLLSNKKQYKKAILLILLATCFHTSSLLFLIFIPLFHDKIKIPKIFMILIPFLMLIMGKLGIINSIINLVLSFSKYSHYTISKTENYFGGSGIVHYFFFIMYVVQIINTMYKKENKIDCFIEKGQMVYFTLFFATINSGWALRLSYLFLIFLPTIPITFIRKINFYNNKRLIYILMTAICLVLAVKSLFIDTKGTKLATNNFSIDFFNQNKK